MNKQRRNYLRSFMLFAATCITGCSTNNHHATRQRNSGFEYTEKVSSVLISNDGSKIFIFTELYHYIFDAPEVIKKSLMSELQHQFAAQFNNFTINSDNKITGEVKILYTGASKKEKMNLIQAGFTNTKFGAEATVHLSGQRYDANNIKPTNQYKLNREYNIPIKYEYEGLDSAAISKPDKTPVSIDSEKVFFYLALPLILPVALFLCREDFDGCLQ